MVIKMWTGKIGRIKMRKIGGVYMNNVLFMEDYMYNEAEKCEWDTISDIFSKAVHRQNISKSDIKKMIAETKNEVRKR